MTKIPMIPGIDLPGDLERTVVSMTAAHRHYDFPTDTQRIAALNRAIATIAMGIRVTDIEAWEEFFSRKVKITRKSSIGP